MKKNNLFAMVLEQDMPQDLTKYIASTDILAANKRDFTFSTSRPETAAIVISKIMEYANDEVKIYEHCLNGDIADTHPLFYETLRTFLQRGKNLKIVLRQEEPLESKLYEQLAEYSEDFPGQIELKVANQQFISNLKNIVDRDVNFTVNDVNSFRIELVPHEQNKSKEAMCNFNNKDIANKLINVFDQEFSNCKEQLLPVFS